ncbi:MAG: hypothetical protein ACO1OD_12785 [Croceibacterium sp.]
MGDRIADDILFPPGGDQQRGTPRERPAEMLRAINARRSTSSGQAQPEPSNVDGQFVERADQEEDSSEEEQLTLDERKPLQRSPSLLQHPR